MCKSRPRRNSASAWNRSASNASPTRRRTWRPSWRKCDPSAMRKRRSFEQKGPRRHSASAMKPWSRPKRSSLPAENRREKSSEAAEKTAAEIYAEGASTGSRVLSFLAFHAGDQENARGKSHGGSSQRPRAVQRTVPRSQTLASRHTAGVCLSDNSAPNVPYTARFRTIPKLDPDITTGDPWLAAGSKPVIFQGMEVGLKMFRWVVALMLVLFFCSGITQVKSEGVGLQLRFGRLVGPPHDPGLLLALPFPDRSGRPGADKTGGRSRNQGGVEEGHHYGGPGQDRSDSRRVLSDRRSEHRADSHRRQVRIVDPFEFSLHFRDAPDSSA